MCIFDFALLQLVYQQPFKNKPQHVKNVFFHNINISDLSLDDLKLFAESLSLDDLKLIAKSKGIKGYKNTSEGRFLSALIKPKIGNEILKKIREDYFNKSSHKLSKSEIKGIRKFFMKQKVKEIFQHEK